MTEVLTLQAAETLVTAAFVACDVPLATAKAVATALVAAEAEGQSGHGFSRIGDYSAQTKSGKVKADAKVRLRQIGPTSALIDAGFGFAYPALDCAADWLVEAVKTYGTASVGVANSHHCGALSYQVDRLARRGCVVMMVANAPKAMAPWGATEPLFGTNPIAFAAPRAGPDPLVIDLSLSVVARGKVMNAKKTGKPIPKGWAIDVEGQPTTDPDAALAGTMLPIGGAKGTALALMVEILSSVMTGSSFSAQAGSFFSADGPPPAVGQFLIAFRPGEEHDVFTSRLEQLLALIAQSKGARLPGARRLAAIALAQRDGISVPSVYVNAARALALGQ